MENLSHNWVRQMYLNDVKSIDKTWVSDETPSMTKAICTRTRLYKSYKNMFVHVTQLSGLFVFTFSQNLRLVVYRTSHWCAQETSSKSMHLWVHLSRSGPMAALPRGDIQLMVATAAMRPGLKKNHLLCTGASRLAVYAGHKYLHS